MARREDEELAGLMDRFICVRVVQGYGMDLTLFQYDYWATWSAFFMNADRTIYGRFMAGRLSDLDRLKKTARAALEAHGKYPANKAGFVGKKGLPLPWKRPEELPTYRGRKLKKADGRRSCIHCHHVLEGIRKSYRQTKLPMPARIKAPYPTTGTVGISIDNRTISTVSQVLKGSPAEAAGVKPGDRILRAGGQQIISIADVEWAIYSAPDEGMLPLALQRDGKTITASLKLRSGWRSDD